MDTDKAEGTIRGTPISQLPESSFAYCEPGDGAVSTRCHFPIRGKDGKPDAAHVRNALARLSTSPFEAKARPAVERAARELGIGTPAKYLKADQLTSAKWRVLAIPFGGPFEGKDLDGEFFSKRTDIKPDWFDRRPLVWHHNLDRNMKADPVLGDADDLELTDEGWWTTVWLNRSHEYWAQVDQLLRAGKIYGSSGSLPNFVRTDHKTGEILVWPYVEQTFTPTPSNFYSVVVAAKAVDHFDEAGIGLSPAVRGLLSDLDGQAADLRNDLSPDGGSPRGDLSDDGGDEAIQRLQGAITHLEELLRKL
jgi:hypothetical protein